ncbi:MAG: TadE/TadG family type IV pilus assembly protein [Planctomycetota bacterium]
MDCVLELWQAPEQLAPPTHADAQTAAQQGPTSSSPAGPRRLGSRRQDPRRQDPRRLRPRRLGPRRLGAVLAECALVLPVLLLFTLATLEFFQALLITDLLQLATREAAREAALMTSPDLAEALTPAQRLAMDEARIRAVVVRRLEAFGLAASGSADQSGGPAEGAASAGNATAKSGWEEIVQVKLWVDQEGQASSISPSLAPVGSSIGVAASLAYDEVAWLPGPRWLTGRTLTAASVLRRE